MSDLTKNIKKIENKNNDDQTNQDKFLHNYEYTFPYFCGITKRNYIDLFSDKNSIGNKGILSNEFLSYIFNNSNSKNNNFINDLNITPQKIKDIDNNLYNNLTNEKFREKTQKFNNNHIIEEKELYNNYNTKDNKDNENKNISKLNNPEENSFLDSTSKIERDIIHRLDIDKFLDKIVSEMKLFRNIPNRSMPKFKKLVLIPCQNDPSLDKNSDFYIKTKINNNTEIENNNIDHSSKICAQTKIENENKSNSSSKRRKMMLKQINNNSWKENNRNNNDKNKEKKKVIQNFKENDFNRTQKKLRSYSQKIQSIITNGILSDNVDSLLDNNIKKRNVITGESEERNDNENKNILFIDKKQINYDRIMKEIKKDKSRKSDKERNNDNEQNSQKEKNEEDIQEIRSSVNKINSGDFRRQNNNNNISKEFQEEDNGRIFLNKKRLISINDNKNINIGNSDIYKPNLSPILMNGPVSNNFSLYLGQQSQINSPLIINSPIIGNNNCLGCGGDNLNFLNFYNNNNNNHLSLSGNYIMQNNNNSFKNVVTPDLCYISDGPSFNASSCKKKNEEEFK